ncbi:MAG: rhomboid family intramembrane serine protease [Bacteroidales bacterium]|nr:rhomboid family intramembrane serine protease [Bacteroidales bacterium]
MDNQIRMGGFKILPEGVKNLLIINVLVFLATYVFQKTGICDLEKWLGLHYFGAPDFHIWQIITYMFMHANFEHIFFNMFALWMFGSAIENHWGTKRFLIYYIITGIGAALVHYVIIFFQIHPTIALFNQFLDNPSLDTFRYLVENNKDVRLKDMFANNLLCLQQNPGSLDELVYITANVKDQLLNSFTIVGASGAVYGLLLAFGMLFPNDRIYLYFLLPIKAKWFVVIFGAIELITGLTAVDGIAHFAHLGGMLFGIILILLWRKTDRNTYYYHYDDYYNSNGDDNDSGVVSKFRAKMAARKAQRTSSASKYYVSSESGRPLSDEEYNARKADEKLHIDAILDKISAKGYDSLTAEEKDFLFKYSQK